MSSVISCDSCDTVSRSLPIVSNTFSRLVSLLEPSIVDLSTIDAVRRAVLLT